MTKTKYVLSGAHFMNGDVACAEGALAAGCRFFAGYPITPATEIAEHLSLRMPEIGGIYIQMEDEIASMAAIIGASYSGLKAMTATSGPGFSLMQENIGLAVMTEAPCVWSWMLCVVDRALVSLQCLGSRMSCRRSGVRMEIMGLSR
jgi:2-oxoglutarate ferredoxin oxidoreductase subunit alpha